MKVEKLECPEVILGGTQEPADYAASEFLGCPPLRWPIPGVGLPVPIDTWF